MQKFTTWTTLNGSGTPLFRKGVVRIIQRRGEGGVIRGRGCYFEVLIRWWGRQTELLRHLADIGQTELFSLCTFFQSRSLSASDTVGFLKTVPKAAAYCWGIDRLCSLKDCTLQEPFSLNKLYLTCGIFNLFFSRWVQLSLHTRILTLHS